MIGISYYFIIAIIFYHHYYGYWYLFPKSLGQGVHMA